MWCSCTKEAGEGEGGRRTNRSRHGYTGAAVSWAGCLSVCTSRLKDGSWGRRTAGSQDHRGSGLQDFRITGKQISGDTGLHNYKITELKEFRTKGPPPNQGGHRAPARHRPRTCQLTHAHTCTHKQSAPAHLHACTKCAKEDTQAEAVCGHASRAALDPPPYCPSFFLKHHLLPFP